MQAVLWLPNGALSRDDLDVTPASFDGRPPRQVEFVIYERSWAVAAGVAQAYPPFVTSAPAHIRFVALRAGHDRMHYVLDPASIPTGRTLKIGYRELSLV